jgi:hypothetical protein
MFYLSSKEIRHCVFLMTECKRNVIELSYDCNLFIYQRHGDTKLKLKIVH